MTQRIGLLGGTFDPIHRGHVDLGTAAWTAMNLTELLVIPAHVPPHRDGAVASPFHRFAMISLALSGLRGWRASDMELRVAEAPSYTVQTLSRFHERGYSATEIFFVIGADAFADVQTWKSADAVLNATNFAVVSRPGHPVSELADRLPQLSSRMTRPPVPEGPSPSTMIFLIDVPTADVSSTAIRRRCEERMSIAGMVHPSVEQHIQQHGLYTSRSHGRRRSDPSAAPAAGRLHD